MPDGPKLTGNSAAAKSEPRYFVIWRRLHRDAILLAPLEPNHAIDHELHEAVVRVSPELALEPWP